MKTMNNVETLKQVAAAQEPDIATEPDVVISIPSIGIQYRQIGRTNMTRAVKVLKDAIERLQVR